MPNKEQNWPEPIIHVALDRKARIAIRGVFGQLGARLAGAIGKQPDIEAVIGIAHPDPTAELRGYALREGSPRMKLYVTDPDHIEPLERKGIQSELWKDDMFGDIDLTIDTTPPGKGVEFAERASNHDATIFVQSGEQGIGRMVVPPKLGEGGDHVFEIGDCNANAIIPVVNALDGIIDKVGIHILMQHGKFFHGRLRDEPVISTYFTSAKPLQRQVAALLPSFDVAINDLISQVPTLRYYTHTYHIDTTVPVDTEEIIELLNKHPRIRCLPHARSTYDIREYDNIIRASGESRLPPIVPIQIRGGDPLNKSKSIDLVVAVDSRRISVLPNIDAARILLWGTDPIEAMRITDKTMRFRDASSSS